MRSLLFSLLIAAVAVLAGCDAIDTASVDQQAIAEAYLEAGEPLPVVILSRSVPISDRSSTPPPETGAAVFVDRLAADGSVAQSTPYAEAEQREGFYFPDVGSASVPTVQGGTTYRLRAELTSGTTLRARTTVPTRLALQQVENTEVVYQGPVQPSFTITRSEVADAPVVFIFTTTSQLDFENTPEEELRAELTPFFADAFDPGEDDVEDFRVNPSPILNEANYDANPNGTITIDLPWIAVSFYGENEVAVSVLDAALYDYLRTQAAQQGGLSPGEIPNVLDNVDGGAGIFGSYARASTRVTILRP